MSSPKSLPGATPTAWQGLAVFPHMLPQRLRCRPGLIEFSPIPRSNHCLMPGSARRPPSSAPGH